MDLLVQKSEEWIRDHLYQNYDGRFCRIEVDEEPEQAGEDDLVLFSDGDTVRAESHIIETSSDSVRVEPLTPVQKPHPKEPLGHGFEYVDAGDCGKYSIKFMGMEHVYETFYDLVKGILEKKPGARNWSDVLCHIVWTEVEERDLNNRQEFVDRLDRAEIISVRDDLQVQRVVFPPMDPDELRKRYTSSSKASRIYQSLGNYVEDVKQFYREQGDDRIVERLENSFSDLDQDSIDARKEVVREKAVGRDLDSAFRGDASA